VRIKNAVVASLMALTFANAQAELFDRGGGLIYDSDLNVTWMANVNLAESNTFGVSGIASNGLMSWNTAESFLATMNGTGYLGFADWRLPSSDLCWGYGCAGSEMGHLFYTELGGRAGSRITDVHDDVSFNLFSNFQPIINGPTTVGHFWLGNNMGNGNAGFFSYDGRQGGDGLSSSHYVLAVRDGDVAAPIPEPETYAMMLAGLGLLGFVARRRKQQSAA
jgi:hypothetical protein